MINPFKLFGVSSYGRGNKDALIDFIRQALWYTNKHVDLSAHSKDPQYRTDELEQTNITFTNVNVTQATINWSLVERAIIYDVTVNGVTSSTKDLTLPVTGLTGGTSYPVTVVATGLKGVDSTTTSTLNTKLNAPSAFAGTPAQTSVALTWTGVTGITYTIERATNSGFTTGLTTVGTTTGTGSINTTGLVASTQYWFRIKGSKVGFPDSNYSTITVTTTA